MITGGIATPGSHPSRSWLARESRTGQIPLVEFCTNEWKNNERGGSTSDLDQPTTSTHISFERLPSISDRRQGGRIVVLLAFLFSFVWLLASTVTLTPQHNDQPVDGGAGASPDSVAEKLDPSHQSKNSFGANRRPQLSGTIQLGTLDVSLLPSVATQSVDQQDRRLIFIGDIHGCLEELMRLLLKIEYKEDTDHIIATGDMINKGPQSQATVDFLRSKGASCVRGNHDDRILLKREQYVSHHGTASTPGDIEDPEMLLALSMTSEQLVYLQSCPIILEVGEIPLYGKMIVVHGGLVPSIALENQDPWTVMNMRIIHPENHIPSKAHAQDGYLPWSELWQHYQTSYLTGDDIPELESKLLKAHRGTTVVYGHDAEQGLRIRKHSKGLDSGCVKGRKLTALIVSNRPDEELVSVDCQRYV